MVATIDPIHAAPRSYRADLPFGLGCVFLALICLPGLGELPEGISLAQLFMGLSLPFWFSAAARRRGSIFDEPARRANAVILTCVAFLMVWSLVSVLDSSAPFRAGRSVVSLATAIAVYLMVAGTLTTVRIGTYIDVISTVLAASCLVSLLAFYEPHLRAMIFQDSDRASGFFKNPNQFGMAISTVLPICLANLMGRPGRFGWRILCLLMLFFGLIACGSKTNLMISALSTVIMLCLYSVVAFDGPRRAFMIVASIVATLLLLAAGALFLQIFNPRALRLLLALADQGGEIHSLTTRSELWRYSVDEFMKNPLSGQGAGQPINIFFRHDTVPHSHNVFLDYLRTLGAPGFAGIAVVLGTAVVLSLATLAKAVASQAATRDRILCIGFSVSALSYIAANMSSDSMGPSTSPLFWVTLFLGLASRSLLARR